MAWGAFREDGHRLRLSASGRALGVNFRRALRRMIHAGVDEDEAERLLSACEIGLLQALNEKDEGEA